MISNLQNHRQRAKQIVSGCGEGAPRPWLEKEICADSPTNIDDLSLFSKMLFGHPSPSLLTPLNNSPLPLACYPFIYMYTLKHTYHKVTTLRRPFLGDSYIFVVWCIQI